MIRGQNDHFLVVPTAARNAAKRGNCVLVSKLPGVGTTIFTVMSQLAAEEGALNLSQGFPDFDGPPVLLDLVERYLRGGHNQYAPMAGVPSLRAAIAAKVLALYARQVDPDREVTVTSGATEAIFCAAQAVIHPGDEAIVLDPCYDSYEPAVTMAGGRTIHVPMTFDFRPDWARIRAAITPRTKLLFLNSPHNPSGSVLAAHDLVALAELVSTFGLYVISDEVYEHIVFDQQLHQSLLRSDELFARSFVVSSFGKTYHTTGWKLGYCVAPGALSEEFRRVHQFVTFCSNTPIQLALADFLGAHPEHHEQLGEFYQAKRDLFCSLLAGTRFTLTPSAGTFFQLLDYGAITDEHDVALARRWTIEEKVAAIPMSVFHAQPPAQTLLRFCFAKDDATLRRGAELLRALA